MVRLFNIYVPLVLVVLAIADATIIPLAWQISASIPGFSSPTETTVFAQGPHDLLTLAVLGLPLLYAMGVYRGEQGDLSGDLVLRILLALTAIAGIVALATSLAGAPALQPVRVGAALFLALVMMLFVRLALQPRRIAERLRTHVIVVGAGRRAQELEQQFATRRFDRIHCAGYVPVDTTEIQVPSGRVLRENDLVALCRRQGVREVVVAGDSGRPDGYADLLRACRRHGISVVDYATFLERELSQLPADDENAPWLLYGSGARTADLLAKRLLDVSISLFILLLTLPVTLVTALLIKLEDGGPVFYAQERVGLQGRTFKVLKFRSMRTDAEADGKARWAQVGDPRVTRIGRFIRKVRIDEIPQVLNVLRNEMSFIGPRPERPAIVEDLVREIPTFALRHMVKPGITGWAQVNYPYGASKEDSVEKLKFDLFYVKNGSFLLDLLIILQTVRVVLWADGAR